MDPEVSERLAPPSSVERIESAADARVRLDVNPNVGVGVVALKPEHAGGESNRRAVRLTHRQALVLLALGLNPAELGAAEAGEG